MCKEKKRIIINLLALALQRERERVIMVTMEESPRSPEAKLGLRVEDLWDIQEPQLSPDEKFNACFESIPVSAFPPPPSNQGTDSFCIIIPYTVNLAVEGRNMKRKSWILISPTNKN